MSKSLTIFKGKEVKLGEKHLISTHFKFCEYSNFKWKINVKYTEFQ